MKDAKSIHQLLKVIGEGESRLQRGVSAPKPPQNSDTKRLEGVSQAWLKLPPVKPYQLFRPNAVALLQSEDCRRDGGWRSCRSY
jgi:hypothetical protein